MSDSEASIVVEHLTKKYSRLTAISDISFSVRKGEVVGFLGPNGAGKSTTMRILTGVSTATSGAAYICGIPVSRKPEEAKLRIGYMPENNPLPEDMRVEEYLRFRARLKELPKGEAKARVIEVCEICKINPKYRRMIIGNLSKGYRQRVGIADAILAKPEIIIMDEPTIGLDPHQVLAIRELIRDLRGRLTVVISSHILAEVELYCDRVIIINQGHIVAMGTPDELRGQFIEREAFTLRASGDREAIGRTIRAAAGEAKVESISEEGEDGFREYRFSLPKGGRDHGERILHDLVGAEGVRVRSLVPKGATLEDIFIAATRPTWSSEDAAATAKAKETPAA